MQPAILQREGGGQGAPLWQGFFVDKPAKRETIFGKQELDKHRELQASRAQSRVATDLMSRDRGFGFGHLRRDSTSCR